MQTKTIQKKSKDSEITPNNRKQLETSQNYPKQPESTQQRKTTQN